jgi:hypothetical protein
MIKKFFAYNSAFFSMAAFVVLLAATPVRATTYLLSGTAGGMSYDGSVTTNGTTGVLQSTDILSWNMTVSALIGSLTYSSSDPGSELNLVGSGLFAQASGLFWDWNADPGFLSFDSHSFADTTPPYADVLFVNQGLVLGQLVNYLFVDLRVDEDNYSDSGYGRLGVGREQIGITSETPLPAALPLFASGVGALGLLGWRRKRKKVAATVAA